MIPSFANMVSFASHEVQPSLDFCTTKEDVDCVTNAYWQFRLNAKTFCPKSCVASEFHGSQRSIIQFESNESAYFEVDYDYDKVVVYEEVPLFDFSSFIGNVGGSLGLFIGFSYFQFAKTVSMAIVDRILQRNI